MPDQRFPSVNHLRSLRCRLVRLKFRAESATLWPAATLIPISDCQDVQGRATLKAIGALLDAFECCDGFFTQADDGELKYFVFEIEGWPEFWEVECGSVLGSTIWALTRLARQWKIESGGSYFFREGTLPATSSATICGQPWDDGFWERWGEYDSITEPETRREWCVAPEDAAVIELCVRRLDELIQNGELPDPHGDEGNRAESGNSEGASAHVTKGRGKKGRPLDQDNPTIAQRVQELRNKAKPIKWCEIPDIILDEFGKRFAVSSLKSLVRRHSQTESTGMMLSRSAA